MLGCRSGRPACGYRSSGRTQLSPCGSTRDVGDRGRRRRGGLSAVLETAGVATARGRRGAVTGARWAWAGRRPSIRWSHRVPGVVDGGRSASCRRVDPPRNEYAVCLVTRARANRTDLPFGSLAYHGESRGIGEPYPRGARVPFTASTRLTADAGDSGRGLASTTAYLHRPPPSSLLRRARTPWHTRGEITSRATCGGAGPFSHAGRATPTDALAKISHKPDGLITRERVCLEGPGTRFALSRRAVCPRRTARRGLPAQALSVCPCTVDGGSCACGFLPAPQPPRRGPLPLGADSPVAISAAPRRNQQDTPARLAAVLLGGADGLLASLAAPTARLRASSLAPRLRSKFWV